MWRHSSNKWSYQWERKISKLMRRPLYMHVSYCVGFWLMLVRVLMHRIKQYCQSRHSWNSVSTSWYKRGRTGLDWRFVNEWVSEWFLLVGRVWRERVFMEQGKRRNEWISSLASKGTSNATQWVLLVPDYQDSLPPSLPPSTVKYTESHDSLQSVKQELQTLQKEHTEYKVKAAGILQVMKRDR